MIRQVAILAAEDVSDADRQRSGFVAPFDAHLATLDPHCVSEITALPDGHLLHGSPDPSAEARGRELGVLPDAVPALLVRAKPAHDGDVVRVRPQREVGTARPSTRSPSAATVRPSISRTSSASGIVGSSSLPSGRVIVAGSYQPESGNQIVTDGLGLENAIARLRVLIAVATSATRLLEAAEFEDRLAAVEAALAAVPP